MRTYGSVHCARQTDGGGGCTIAGCTGRTLQAARLHCAGKLWCVFGCGGDRDKGKRPLMGAIARRVC
ncbi:glutamate ligase domain-containing protein [Escherichia coli]